MKNLLTLITVSAIALSSLTAAQACENQAQSNFEQLLSISNYDNSNNNDTESYDFVISDCDHQQAENNQQTLHSYASNEQHSLHSATNLLNMKAQIN